MSPDKIEELRDKIYDIADDQQYYHSFDSIYDNLMSLYRELDSILEKEQKYIVYADCRTFKSNINTLKEAKEWQNLIGGDIYLKIN